MSRARTVLYLGDVLVILLFAIIGRQSHNLATGIRGAGATLLTAAPFLVAWLLVGSFLGAFRPLAWANLRSTLRATLLAFIPAYIVGVILRTLLLGRLSPPAFYLVTAGILASMLLIWRLLHTLFVAPRLHDD